MKCAAYIRTASKNHVDKNLRKQTKMIKAFILENNWELEYIYSDVGSGVNKNKNLSIMIEDAHQGKFDIIVAINPSRLFRNSELSSEIRNLCKMNKTNIVTVDNRINIIQNNDENY
jgi:DNA invertase Pin-like site-specific DNA recombinase